MTDMEKSKLEMYESVLMFLSENKDIVDNINAFNWSICRLKKLIDEINLKEQILSGAALDRVIRTSKARDELIYALLPVSSGLFQYANEINDPELKQKTKFSRSAIKHLMNSELIDRANSLETMARKYLGYTRKYGISPAALKQMKTKIQNFSGSLRNEEINSISNNVLLSMGNLFADADKILNSYMDNFVEALADEYPDFYDEYRLVRNIENQNKIRVLMEIEEE